MSSLMKKAILPTAIALTMISTTSQATLSDITSFFNDGAYVTSKTGTTFSGQTRNYATGGSWNVRYPKKSYQLATMSPPNIGASCSGIDLYGGSYSFINSTQLTDMMKNIGNNAKGAIFQIALQSISPIVSAVIGFFQNMANRINALNINSCKAAEGIVMAAKDGKLDASAKNLFSKIGSETAGVGADWNKMRESIANFSTGTETADTLNHVKNSGTAEQKEEMMPGNVLMQALSNAKIGAVVMSDAEKDLIQSLIGSVILETKLNGGTPTMEVTVLPPLIYFPIEEFIGDKDTPTVNINAYQCSALSINCDKVDLGADGLPLTKLIAISSIHYAINKKIQDVRTKVVDRTGGISVTDKEIVDLSFLPIWQIIETEYRTKGAMNILNNSQELVAVSYAKAMLQETLRGVSKVLSMYSNKNLNDGVLEEIQQMQDRISKLDTELQAYFAAELYKFNTYSNSLNLLKLRTNQVREETAKALMQARSFSSR